MSQPPESSPWPDPSQSSGMPPQAQGSRQQTPRDHSSHEQQPPSEPSSYGQAPYQHSSYEQSPYQHSSYEQSPYRAPGPSSAEYLPDEPPAAGQMPSYPPAPQGYPAGVPTYPSGPPQPYRVGMTANGVPVAFAPPPPKPTPYPLDPQPHHHFWRAPRWHWWKSLVILVVGGGAFFLLQFAAIFVAAGIDNATGRVPWSQFQKEVSSGTLATTPAVFIANNVSLDLLVPGAMLLAWAVTGQRPGWLASVTGRVRWGWLMRCIAWILPLWLVLAVLEYVGSRNDPSNALHVTHDTLPLILGIVLTTPLQCAGEEFAFRGIINRAVAAWFPPQWLGFAAGGLANSLLFMLAHGAGDPWLNVYYFLFGMVGTWLARRTGGLEASIAVHVVNNVTAEWMLPFTNISGMFDRGAGTAGPEVLINAALPLLAVAIIEWRARREHVVSRWTPEREPSASGAAPIVPGRGWNAT